jgi:hypothetical protein
VISPNKVFRDKGINSIQVLLHQEESKVLILDALDKMLSADENKLRFAEEGGARFLGELVRWVGGLKGRYHIQEFVSGFLASMCNRASTDDPEQVASSIVSLFGTAKRFIRLLSLMHGQNRFFMYQTLNYITRTSRWFASSFRCVLFLFSLGSFSL